MSKELQEKADIMIKELNDALIPIQEELRVMRASSSEHRYKSYKEKT